MLMWSSRNGETVDLEPGIGNVQGTGRMTVTPEQTTTYTLTVKGSGGTSKASTMVTVTDSTSTTTGIQISPGDDIQAAVNANPSGTTFLLAPGLYRLQSVVPKAGDVFSGQSGAVLDGAALIHPSSWRQVSSNKWMAQVFGITQQASYRGVCEPTRPACMYPEDLFFDSKPLVRVTSNSLVSAGAWYLDYSTDKVYVGTDPAGHTVELSQARAAFWGSASNVTIRGLTIEKYASLAGKGAINAMAALDGYGPPGTDWVVDSNDIYLNHAAGVRVSNGMVVTSNKLHDNGELGLSGSGSNILVKDNKIYKNNYAGYSYHWEGGGAKIAPFSTHVTFDHNDVHDNMGPGLHADISDEYVTIENNHTTRNIAFGIHYEISYHGVIKNNLVEDDGLPPDGHTGPWYSAGIMVSNSKGIEVYGNTVTNCTNGILGSYADRGVDSKTGVPYTLNNLNVHDNTITQQRGFAAGIVKGSTFDNSVYAMWDNHFKGGTYNLSNSTYTYFCWLDQKWTYDKWQTYTSEH